MPVLTNPNLPPGMLPDPTEMPVVQSDAVLANFALKQIGTVRAAVRSGLIPPEAIIQTPGGRRMYRQVDLRRYFGLPPTGEVRIGHPLW